MLGVYTRFWLHDISDPRLIYRFNAIQSYNAPARIHSHMGSVQMSSAGMLIFEHRMTRLGDPTGNRTPAGGSKIHCPNR